MGAFLEKPITTKTEDKGEGPKGIRYGVSAMQGWRKDMEDKHICNTKFVLEGHAFFGVFDGHAGVQASEHCSKFLLEHIMSETNPKSQAQLPPDTIKDGLEKGFVSFDQKMLTDLGYADSKMRGGTTAVTAMITPDDIIWANCGDSRGILCRSGSLHFNTEDHKPFLEKEQKRIESAGGTVMMQRVNGSLAVSRALGDFEFKTTEENRETILDNPVVSAKPDVTITKRDEANDEFLLLACDGVYDVMTNEEIVKFVRNKLSTTSNLPEICNSLIDLCLYKNSRDNMSVIIVTFPGAPKVSDEAVEKERELVQNGKTFIEEEITKAVANTSDAMDLDEMEILSQLVEAIKEKPELTGFDIYTQRPFVADTLAEKKKAKFGPMDFMEGPTDASEAPSHFQHFQVPADEIFQSETAMQTEGGSDSGKDTSSQLTDSSTSPV